VSGDYHAMLLFSISPWSEGGKHLKADLDLTNDIISKNS
jgi:hypothetical protein